MSRPRKLLIGIAAKIQRTIAHVHSFKQDGLGLMDHVLIQNVAIQPDLLARRKVGERLGDLLKRNLPVVTRAIESEASYFAERDARLYLSAQVLLDANERPVVLMRLPTKDVLSLIEQHGVRISLRALEQLRGRMAEEEHAWLTNTADIGAALARRRLGLERDEMPPENYSDAFADRIQPHILRDYFQVLEDALDDRLELQFDMPPECKRLRGLLRFWRVRLNGSDVKAGRQPTRQSRSPNGANPRAARRAPRHGA